MTGARAAGAASHTPVDWHQSTWDAVHRNVRRLQARIVQATKAGRWGKVQARQHLLTHSLSGRALAIKRVTENHGNRTPGVDGETWPTPTKKAAALCALRRRGYCPRPWRRVYIPKSNGKTRPLGMPTRHDRAMQALFLLALEPIAETTADPNSYGFRPGRSTADAIGQCDLILHKPHAPAWVLEGDIKACFDQISHEWLLTHVPMDKGMLHKWLKAGYMAQHVLYPTASGTPQGGIVTLPTKLQTCCESSRRVFHGHHYAPALGTGFSGHHSRADSPWRSWRHGSKETNVARRAHLRRSTLEVRRTVAPSRVRPACVTQAYARVVPIPRRPTSQGLRTRPAEGAPLTQQVGRRAAS